MRRPAILLILDGYGIAPPSPHNAVQNADTPVLDALRERNSCLLDASGEAVGLRPGLMGSSEVNHLNMGAGRIVKQDILRVDHAIKDGSLERSDALRHAFSVDGDVHLVGLVSDGGIHSHIDHLRALIRYAKDAGRKKVYVHAILDGRDTAERVASKWLEELDADGSVELSTIMGRFYAMDRDTRWQRTEQAYRAMLREDADVADWRQALDEDYGRELSDEFIVPRSLPGRPVRPGDSLIFFNFRSDRPRQLAAAFTKKDFAGFARERISDLYFVQMTEYDAENPLPTLVPPASMKNVLAEWLSTHDVKQLHIAETEKYAHVTFFFNGGREQPFPGEDRVIVPSPKVETYDQQPEMSVYEITERVVAALSAGGHDAYIINFANADMVGHTGRYDATVKALEAVDECVGTLKAAVQQAGGVLIVTADHGNAEDMTGDETTTHTTNKVPFMLLDDGIKELRDGIIPDVAPTFLDLVGLPVPEEMTASSLLGPHKA